MLDKQETSGKENSYEDLSTRNIDMEANLGARKYKMSSENSFSAINMSFAIRTWYDSKCHQEITTNDTPQRRFCQSHIIKQLYARASIDINLLPRRLVSFLRNNYTLLFFHFLLHRVIITNTLQYFFIFTRFCISTMKAFSHPVR